MKKLNLFAQLSKVDETKREVWGIATAEVVDKEGEIFDYSTSKKYFKDWSDEISKATDGKSLGNVREMHEPSAVGKLVDLTFDDDLKQIQVGAKIVDDTAWKKCMEGVYTGFSIGGAYVKAWKDGEFVRFTANPAEISVVDNPCVPTAHFTAVKADGTAEVRKFSQQGSELSSPAAVKAGATVQKDMYSVSNLAALLQSLVYLQMDTAFEAEYEGDESPIPAELATWVKDGAAILARMTEEELTELLGTMKAAEPKFGKKGAKFSAKTKKHLEGIQKCVKDTQDHLDALGKDDGMAESAPVDITKSSAATPQISEGETDMLDVNEKAQLNKAAADSASALQQNTEINTKLDKLASLIHKFVETQVGKTEGQTVARTAVPAITVTKNQDIPGTPAQPGALTAAEQELTREMTREELQKLTPAQADARFHALAKVSYQNPSVVYHTPLNGR